MKSFKGVKIQSINVCPNIEYSSGIKTKLYYAPASYFLKIDLPEKKSLYQESVTITNDIEFRGGSWESIDILIDENELKVLLFGAVGRKKIKTELNIYILGLRTEILGFLEIHANTAFVFAITDANNNNWIIGNLRNRSFIQEAELSSGKKYEDISGVSAKIISNSQLYLYPKKIEEVEISGAFTKGFSIGFKS